MLVSADNMRKLEKADAALADAQVSILHEEERLQVPKESQQWQRLYAIRVELAREVHRLRTVSLEAGGD